MTISTTNGDTPNSPETLTYSAYIKEELRRYDEHIRDVRGLSAGTRKDRLRIIGLLLEGKFKHREVVFARMQPDDVRQFLSTRLAQRQTSSNASQHAAALRGYLRYRATCGDSVAQLAAVIQNPAATRAHARRDWAPAGIVLHPVPLAEAKLRHHPLRIGSWAALGRNRRPEDQRH